MWAHLDSATYQRFHNLIVPSENGTSQLDHVISSPHGVFIVETKNLKGWIFGSEDNQKWTQALYGKKYQFQNPLRQAYRQKKVLAKFLAIDESLISVAVLFVCDCKFKTTMPSNVMKSGIGSYIKSYKKTVLSGSEINRISAILKNLESEPKFTKREHISSLKQRHGSTTLCPKCGSQLVERTAKKGPNAGSTFLGCSGYPKCRYTKNV
tara:strand:- start:157 stop:783 length:627 start_codon:yes stop_codon:yes gene_type:complete